MVVETLFQRFLFIFLNLVVRVIGPDDWCKKKNNEKKIRKKNLK